jgi:hypothetical protein
VEENTADSTPVETKEQDSPIEATSRDQEDEEDSIKQLKQKVRISNSIHRKKSLMIFLSPAWDVAN